MAHNLEERNGVYSFVSNVGVDRKDIPWHGLGKEFNRMITVNEAMEECRANFNVRKDGLLRATAEEIEMIKNGIPLNRQFTESDIITSHGCTVREDLGTILGVVGKDYGVVQNKTGFEFIDIITSGKLGDGNNPIIETAGVLGQGEKIFITAKMPEPIKIKDTDDIIEDYILFTTSHDGSGAVTAMFTPIRVVCNNTLNMALQHNKNKISFRHSKHIGNILDFNEKQNINMALEVMKVHKYYKNEFSDTINMLASKAISDMDVIQQISKMFLDKNQIAKLSANNWVVDGVDEISTRTANTIKDLRESVYTGVGQNKWRGTALWLVNGITTHYGNEKAYKHGKEQRFNGLIDGDGYKKMQLITDNLLAI